ncbi:hypothetical protein [Dyella sp.]|uniref:hypothetical protein n=1 Tax=Dyella sp. TaxID=1869338 RepID=UPI002D7FDD0B|nr:hypothetical protein [Dyella sp.]
MSCLHRYRLLLLAFSALVLLLLTSANVAFDSHLHRTLSVSGTASAVTTVAAAHGAHAHSSFTTDDGSSNSGLCDDDCDIDDQLIAPELTRAVLRPLASESSPDMTPSLRSTPFIELLRPPRAA